MNKNVINQEYNKFLKDLTRKVSESRYQAATGLNQELTRLYHYIGSEIIVNQNKYGWGAKIINQLSKDLKSVFPDMQGFSPQNLKYMKRFAEEYTPETIDQQSIDKLP